jgi:regulator of protease activity HflC (stomatin/prohibitin superfamily)
MIKRDRYGDIDPEAILVAARNNINSIKETFSMKKIMSIIMLVVLTFVVIISAGSIIETVPTGHYQVKQAVWSGDMSARMKPGTYFQNFGDIFTFPNSETFFFTKEANEGGKFDQSIKVTFADGSECQISGTARIVMPSTQEEAIYLTDKLGFRRYEDIEHKLILPTIRRALVLTATMMTAQESYNVKRPDFLKWASGQIEHGIAATTEEEKEIVDPVTNEKVVKVFKKIKTNDKGETIYESNPLAGTGIRLQNFEVKDFEYSNEVKKQIAEQQQAIMGVATAKANALKAEQAKITAEANGQANVMTAKYEEEQKKIRAVVDAEKEKEVMLIAARRDKDKAEFAKQTAEFTKQEQILLGQGEGERKRLVMEADGAPSIKLEAYKYGIAEVEKAWALVVVIVVILSLLLII